MSTTHVFPGIYTQFGAAKGSAVSAARMVAVIAPADAAEGVQLVTSEQQAATLYGMTSQMYRLLIACMANGSGSLYAFAVESDTVSAYQSAMSALFAACKPGLLVIASGNLNVQLAVRSVLDANACIGLVGLSSGTRYDYLERARALCCERMVLIAPCAMAANEVLFDAACAAAALAGALSALNSPTTSLHNIPLSGITALSEDYDDSTMGGLIVGGVTPLRQSGGQMQIVRVVTTRAADTDLVAADAFRSLNAVLITDILLQTLRRALDERFALAQNNGLTRNAVYNCVLLVLQDLRRRGYLESFEALQVFPDSEDQTLCRISFTYHIAASLHSIAVSAALSV
ncbi:MAG: hypothetical protein LBM28_01235 [Oscillospiraceae bacterium]|jgi:phage tail sheath gpL-like|nr:hypothetical protein [Oscillospiraceae bacterium]